MLLWWYNVHAGSHRSQPLAPYRPTTRHPALSKTSRQMPSVHGADKMEHLVGDAHLCLEWQCYLITQLGEIPKKKRHGVASWKANFSISGTGRLLSRNGIERGVMWHFQKDKNLKKKMADLISLPSVLRGPLGVYFTTVPPGTTMLWPTCVPTQGLLALKSQNYPYCDKGSCTISNSLSSHALTGAEDVHLGRKLHQIFGSSWKRWRKRWKE